MHMIQTVAVDVGASVDKVRQLVRTTPELRRLGRRMGCARIYSDDGVKQIKRAYEASKRELTKA